MSAEERLLILLKAPILGTVKTRLAADIGSDTALSIYRRLLDQVVIAMSPLSAVELHYTPATAGELLSPWLKPGWQLYPQSEGNLGDRMHHSFSQAFTTGAKRVVMIGTDCPSVELADIRRAWTVLADHDLVLGPATDGGYWLIGLNRPRPELFKDINWSTSTVLSETLACANQLGLSHQLLRPLSDVDTKTDWDAYLANHSAQTLE